MKFLAAAFILISIGCGKPQAETPIQPYQPPPIATGGFTPVASVSPGPNCPRFIEGPCLFSSCYDCTKTGYLYLQFPDGLKATCPKCP